MFNTLHTTKVYNTVSIRLFWLKYHHVFIIIPSPASSQVVAGLGGENLGGLDSLEDHGCVFNAFIQEIHFRSMAAKVSSLIVMIGIDCCQIQSPESFPKDLSQNNLMDDELTHHFLLNPLRRKYEHHGRIFRVLSPNKTA
jgi:hypothetical protein